MKNLVEIWLPGTPVLLNQILSTPPRHQSRIKQNGKKIKSSRGTKIYYGSNVIQAEAIRQQLPKYDKPVHLEIILINSRYDIDAPLKAILDAIQQRKGSPVGILDDNKKGLLSLKISYMNGGTEGVLLRFSEDGDQ